MAAATTTTTTTAVAGLASLGASYDVFGYYADAESTGRQVIDLGDDLVPVAVGGRRVMVPSTVQLVPLDNTALTMTQGSTITNFQSSLAQSAGLTGSYGFFTGSVDESFGSDVATSSEYYYWQISEVVKLWKLSLPPLDQLQSMLDPTFASALQNADPATLFSEFAPYFVTNCIVGGAATGTAYCNKRDVSNSTTVTAAVSAGFAGCVGFNGAVSTSSTVQTMLSQYNLKITTSGGSPGANLAPGDVSGFEAWAQSVADAPVLVQFEPDSLVGIWELCSDSTRQQELLDYFTTSILPNHPALQPVAPVLTGQWQTLTPTQRTWDDKGSGADMNADFYVPPTGDGWFAVGAYAQGGGTDYQYGSPVEWPVLLVQSSDGSALVEPDGWTAVWSYENPFSSSGPIRFTIWNANPPAGYVALGAWITVETENLNSPPAPPAPGQFKCVRSDLADPATYGALIWWDKNSGHKGDVALYTIAAGPSSVAAHTFATVPNYDPTTPQSPPVYCLDAAAITLTNDGSS